MKKTKAKKRNFANLSHVVISLDMFEWVKWLVLWNLSLIYIIMMIREKKIGTLSTEIAPTETKMVKFGPKKAYHSTCTLKAPNELCFGT